MVAVRGKKLQFPQVSLWNLNSETDTFCGSDSISEKFCDPTLKYTVASLFHVVIRNLQCLYNLSILLSLEIKFLYTNQYIRNMKSTLTSH